MATSTNPASTTEAAPLPNLFGPATADVVRAVLLRPDMAPRLLLAPRRDLHARAAAAQRMRELGATDRDLADALADRDPRDLLRLALGDHGAGRAEFDLRLHGLLDRATTPAWCLADYRALDAALRAGMSDALPGDNDLRPEDARLARRIMDDDPIVLRARRAIVRDGVPVVALADVLGFLRRAGALDALGDLPDGSGRRAALRRLRRDVGGFPSPREADFPTPLGWRLVATVRELWHLGNRLSLCFGSARGYGAVSHAMALASGRSVYLHHAGADAVAEVTFDFDGSACVGEVRGASNARADPKLADGLRDDLRAAGLAVTACGVAAALTHLLSSPAGRGTDDWYGDVANLVDAEDWTLVLEGAR